MTDARWRSRALDPGGPAHLPAQGGPAHLPAQGGPAHLPARGGRGRNAITRVVAAGRGDLGPLLLITAAVLVANAAVLAHAVSVNPLALDAWLGGGGNGVLPGLPYIDPNAGFVNQAVGHLAAVSWLHGHVPWWNPYEGIGTPLVGEMQNAALFPLVLLLRASWGLEALHLVVEIGTGIGTYLLLRRLAVGRGPAVAGGVAFGLCGTFAWFADNPGTPVLLLPLLLLAVERATDAASGGRRRGWLLLPVALALSVVAGFPETAFIDLLLVAVWALARLVSLPPAARIRLVGKLAAGGALGAALAAPAIVAFADFLHGANIGGHAGGFATAHVPAPGLAQLLLPYDLGPIFAFHSVGATDTITAVWSNVGGYVGATVFLFALIGVVGRRQRPLRLALGAWVVLCLARTYGLHPVVAVFAHLPGIRSTAFYRYDNPAWDLALVVLAAFGMDDIRRRLVRPAVVAGAAVVAVAALAASAAAASGLLGGAVAAGTTPAASPAHQQLYPLVSAVAAAVLLVAGAGAALAHLRRRPGVDVRRRSQRHPGPAGGRLVAVMAAVVAVEAVGLAGFTFLSAPPPAPVHQGPVRFLASHLGIHRFATLGPIQPNYGSYFGLAELDMNDLPFPNSFQTLIHDRLAPNSPDLSFTGVSLVDPAGPSPAQELSAHLAAYESLGVSYVVVPASSTDVVGRPFPSPGTPPWPAGPRPVYRDPVAVIYQLPHPAPAMSLQGAPAGCRTRVASWDTVEVSCPTPSVLVRRVLAAPGWTATVRPARGPATTRPVVADPRVPGAALQMVALPAGRLTVHFTYLPRHETAALAVAAMALAVLLGLVALAAREAHPASAGAVTGGRPDDPAGAHRPDDPTSAGRATGARWTRRTRRQHPGSLSALTEVRRTDAGGAAPRRRQTPSG